MGVLDECTLHVLPVWSLWSCCGDGQEEKEKASTQACPQQGFGSATGITATSCERCSDCAGGRATHICVVTNDRFISHHSSGAECTDQVCAGPKRSPDIRATCCAELFTVLSLAISTIDFCASSKRCCEQEPAHGCKYCTRR